MKISASEIETFKQYFQGQGVFEGMGLDNLPTQYVWPQKGTFPELDGIEFSGSNYQKNLQLKSGFRRQWDSGDRLALANWIISDWGGIKTNQPQTIERYVADIEQDTLSLDLSGVASYSKVLAFIDPNKYAIYDARVAASLNLIQLIARTEKPVLWCDLPGRNSQIEDFKKKEGARKPLKVHGWTPVLRESCYKRYNDLLSELLVVLPGAKLFELEMSLFANAELLVSKLREQPADK